MRFSRAFLVMAFTILFAGSAKAGPVNESALIQSAYQELEPKIPQKWRYRCATALGDPLAQASKNFPTSLQGPAYFLMKYFTRIVPENDPARQLLESVVNEAGGKKLLSGSRLLAFANLTTEMSRQRTEPPYTVDMGSLGFTDMTSAQGVTVSYYNLGDDNDGNPIGVLSADFHRIDRGTVLGQSIDATNWETVYLLVSAKNANHPKVLEALKSASEYLRESGATLGLVPPLIREGLVQAALIFVKDRRSANQGTPMRTYFFNDEEQVRTEGSFDSIRPALYWTLLIRSLSAKAPLPERRSLIGSGQMTEVIPVKKEELPLSERVSRGAGRWLRIGSVFNARRVQLQKSPTLSLATLFTDAPLESDRLLVVEATKQLPAQHRNPLYAKLLGDKSLEVRKAALEAMNDDKDFQWTAELSEPMGKMFAITFPDIEELVKKLTMGRSDPHSLAAIKFGMYHVRMGENFDGLPQRLMHIKYKIPESFVGRTDEAHIDLIDRLLHDGLTGPIGEYCRDWHQMLLELLVEARKISPAMDLKITTLVRQRIADDSWDYIPANMLGAGGRNYTVEVPGLRGRLLGPLK